jgi:hypothetical protein
MTKTKEKTKVKWLKEAEEHDYSAAKSYLNLTYSTKETDAIIKAFMQKKGSIEEFKAKDIFRASGLSLLGVSNFHVENDRKRIKKEVALSPMLLFVDVSVHKLVIADGYHRMCAAYIYDEDLVVPCRIVRSDEIGRGRKLAGGTKRSPGRPRRQL